MSGPTTCIILEISVCMFRKISACCAVVCLRRVGLLREVAEMFVAKVNVTIRSPHTDSFIPRHTLEPRRSGRPSFPRVVEILRLRYGAKITTSMVTLATIFMITNFSTRNFENQLVHPDARHRIPVGVDHPREPRQQGIVPVIYSDKFPALYPDTSHSMEMSIAGDGTASAVAISCKKLATV